MVLVLLQSELYVANSFRKGSDTEERLDRAIP